MVVRIAGMAGCVVLLLAATACTTATGTTAPPTPTPTFDPAAVACANAQPAPPPDFAGENLGSSGPSGRFTVACPMLIDPHPVGWYAAVVAKDDRTVTIYFMGGIICSGLLQRVDVVETETEVTVSIYLGVARVLVPSGRGVCNASGQLFATVVRLATPLGKRQLTTPHLASDGPPVVTHL